MSSSFNSKKDVLLVNQEEVTKSKANGGLEIRKMREPNTASLAKNGQKVMKIERNISADMWRGKYVDNKK